MKFDIIWLPDAEMELASLWMNSTKREAVTSASDAIEKRLEENGPIEGESRDHGLRITFEAPLAVVFRVDILNHVVHVGQVWEFQ